MFATDKKYRKYKIICRYQQFEGANMIVSRVLAGYPKKGADLAFPGLRKIAADGIRRTKAAYDT